MKIATSEGTTWRWLFFAIIAAYCLFYAPFGVNETDGGFLTGLAWQVMNGKILYKDIIYVRPPLPVWWRMLELQILPDNLAILGERWIFYLKIATYSWLGASLLYAGPKRWVLATLGFVVSANCYPPMAWHTIDGILISVASVFFYFKFGRGKFGLFMSGLAGSGLLWALLCKQSFYPFALLFLLAILLEHRLDRMKVAFFIGSFIGTLLLFIHYLIENDIYYNFLDMTSGAAGSKEALQHGIIDYFMITPELLVPSLLMLGLIFWFRRQKSNPKLVGLLWGGWFFALPLSFAALILLRHDHIAPFAQTRAIFWVAAGWLLYQFCQGKEHFRQPRLLTATLLLGITWCAAISWGYSLPLLFATPWLWGAMEVSREVFPGHMRWEKYYRLAALAVLLLTFRLGYEHVYRDGLRCSMTENMGEIFPQLSGIYSSTTTAARYLDLKILAQKYGPVFKVLPAFPQANYLTNTTPPLPLDWVVTRESNGDNRLIIKAFMTKKPVVFLEKWAEDKISTDPEFAAVKILLEKCELVEETTFFKIYKFQSAQPF